MPSGPGLSLSRIDGKPSVPAGMHRMICLMLTTSAEARSLDRHAEAPIR